MKPQYAMKNKTRKNPQPVLNKQGGVYPTTSFELVRAKLVDLGTLPKSLCGTSCGNCIWMRGKDKKIGYCAHKLVSQAVTSRQCCALWRGKGWLTASRTM